MLTLLRNKCTVVCISLVLVVLLATSCAPAATPLPPSATPTTAPVATPTVAPTATVPAVPTPTTAPMATPTVAPTAAVPALPTPTLASTGVPASYEEIQRISPEELKALIVRGADIVVVDNQPQSAYEIRHIPGAVNFPWAMEITGPGNLPKDKLLILYCACAHEEDAGDVAMKLITNFGYKNIMLLDGGLLRWVELEYPVQDSFTDACGG